MFGQIPSLASVLNSARHAHHYTAEISPHGVKLITTDLDDHRQAMEAMPYLLQAVALVGINRATPLPASDVQPIAPPIAPPLQTPTTATLEVPLNEEPTHQKVVQIEVREDANLEIQPDTAPILSFDRTPIKCTGESSGRPVQSSSPSQIKPVMNVVDAQSPSTYQPRISDSEVSYLEHLKQSNRSQSMQRQSAAAIKMFKEAVGDKFIKDIKARDVDCFMSTLSVYPKNAGKSRRYRDLTADVIAEKCKDIATGRISMQTQDKHSDRMRHFFKWCVNRDELARSPFTGRPRLTKKSLGAKKVKTFFEPEDLQTLFDPERIATLDTPAKFWVPLMAYFQGMRLNEICQLYVDDIIVQDGIKGIDISPDREGQRLKNGHSRRFLPMHNELVRLGFLKYVADVRSSGSKHLFPGLKWGENGPGDSIGDWFNRTYLRKDCGITDKRKTFHSFRHTFVCTGIWSRVPDSEISELGFYPDFADS
jgi:integrase